MRIKIKFKIGIFSLLLLLFSNSVFAAGPPAPSLFSNGLAVALLSLMVVLLIVIGILANILTGAAEVKVKKRKVAEAGKVAMLIGLLFIAPSLIAQDAATNAVTTATTIGGLSKGTFYVMIGIILVELLVIIAMLINLRFLINKEKEQQLTVAEKAVVEKEKANKLGFWARFHNLKPMSQEADLDSGHEYDGIRELDNRLPPWWLYGFYASIIFAVIYLWRFHVSHNGPSSKQEYETSVAKAKAKVDAYLKKKGDAVDENTVTLLTGADDLAAGKAIFIDPAKCPACHNADGGGNAIGPNLTDDYWLYGGSVKDIFKTIKYGTNKGMRSWKDDLSAKQIAQVSSYIKSVLHGSKPANAKAAQGELYKEAGTPATAPTADSTGGTK